MDWTIYAVAGRVIERLLVVLSAGLSVYLGYRLFLQIPDVRDAQGEIKMPSMNMAVKVSRVGPGVFFAIFGAAVLLASYLNPITITPPKDPAPAGKRQDLSFSGASPTQSEQDQILRRRQAAVSLSSLNAVEAALSKDKAHFNSVRDAKLLMVSLVWDPQWGNFADFQQAVFDGRNSDDVSLPRPTRDALRFYGKVEGR
jgi:hypothetical protein